MRIYFCASPRNPGRRKLPLGVSRLVFVPLCKKYARRTERGKKRLCSRMDLSLEPKGKCVDGKFFGMRIPLVESRFNLSSGKGLAGLKRNNDKGTMKSDNHEC